MSEGLQQSWVITFTKRGGSILRKKSVFKLELQVKILAPAENPYLGSKYFTVQRILLVINKYVTVIKKQKSNKKESTYTIKNKSQSLTGRIV